ncbi:carboxylesterase family protein [Paraburkholderia graminis]|uniref:carboxylesterase/lipase family protein n=1 Tax=Paraburkholderia graminis TaxID=60548 RepID=UPI0038BAD26A
MQQAVGPQVALATGSMTGRVIGGVAEYRGVPYAAAPVGERRFGPPKPAETWAGVRDAAQDGAIAPQSPSRVYASMGAFEAAQAEDCLYLTLWAPEGANSGRPVIVWFHGGGFMTGAGSAPWYDGAALASACDAVVVNVNYRLGALGFLSIPGVVDGNLAILDQVCALRWVQENIHVFGGDARRVTVIGQSGGGHNIASILSMPGTDGLFARAVLMSPPLGVDLQSEAGAARTRERFLELCNISPDSPDLAAELRRLSVAQILDAQSATARSLGQMDKGDLRPPFMPCTAAPHALAASGLIDAAAKGAAARGIEMLVGWTRDEANLFYFGQSDLQPVDHEQLRRMVAELPYGRTEGLLNTVRERRPEGSNVQWWLDAVADVTFRLPSQALADAVVANGGCAFVYQFDWPSPELRLGACHCVDIPFFFGTFKQWASAPIMAGARPESYEPVSRQAMSMLAQFVRSGETGFPQWNPSDPFIHHFG